MGYAEKPKKSSMVSDVKKSKSTSHWVINPRRLVDIFTSMDYSIGQAVCDLIDNCVDADATEVSVEFNYNDRGKRYLIVRDNGSGIRLADIDEAMSLGAERAYYEANLGKFGIGLKLSSLSQAEEVTLLSRDPDTKHLGCRRISAQHIRDVDRLELLHDPQDTDFARRAQKLVGNSGTVVLWENMDKFRLAFGKKSVVEAHLKGVANLREFISLVFHRFLADQVQDRKRLKIQVNNQRLSPLDPFAENETHDVYGTIVATEPVATSADGTTPDLEVGMFILPHSSRMSSDELRKRMGAICSANEAQGLYFYRNCRLISIGGWECLSKSQDEHQKLAKVAIDVPIELDEMFRLNPTKTAYKPPVDFVEALQALLSSKRSWQPTDTKAMTFWKKAQTRYRKEGKQSVSSRRPSRLQTHTPTEIQSSGPSQLTQTPQPPKVVAIKLVSNGPLLEQVHEADMLIVRINRKHDLYEATRNALKVTILETK